MVSVRTSRRGHGEDSIYFDAEKNRYVGAVSLGHGGDGTRVRRKVYGKTKQDVRLKLKTLRSGITAGVRAPASNTVQAAVDDWPDAGAARRSRVRLRHARCWPGTALTTVSAGQDGSVGMALMWSAGIPVEAMNWGYRVPPAGPPPAPR